MVDAEIRVQLKAGLSCGKGQGRREGIWLEEMKWTNIYECETLSEATQLC